MCIEDQPTTFLQIFYKLLFNFKVIFKSIVDPDDECPVELQAREGQILDNIFVNTSGLFSDHRARWALN